MIHAESFDFVQWHKDLHQKVLVFFFEWKCKAIDNTMYLKQNKKKSLMQ